MARWEFKLPDVGEGVSEGEIVAWLVKPGDVVTEDQPIVEVMTDKATVTITAPKAGVVVETRGRVGEIVPVHSVLVVFELDGVRGPAPRPLERHEGAPDAPENEPRRPRSASFARRCPAWRRAGYFNEKPLATPATRKLAREMEVDLRRVPPSGPAGRVTRRDVEGFRPSPEAPRAPAPSVTSAPTPASAPATDGAGDVRRRAGADRGHAPADRPEDGAVEVDRGALHVRRGVRRDGSQGAARAPQGAPPRREGVKLSFLPFVVKAVVAALKKHPMLNTTLDETRNEIVFRKYFHIGIATATDAGLVVPVVKDADKKSVLEIAREIERLAQEARAGKAKAEDLSGSTFTITSLGAKGGLFATPIINFPEVAILGVHQMKTKPVVRDGQIVIGDVMLLSLSFDHRIVDGHVGAAFALDVIAYLEKPETLLLELA